MEHEVEGVRPRYRPKKTVRYVNLSGRMHGLQSMEETDKG